MSSYARTTVKESLTGRRNESSNEVLAGIPDLGLALSREILDISGISITETGEPGKGARFEMTVPEGTWRKNEVGD